jgi:hypothetical protein
VQAAKAEFICKSHIFLASALHTNMYEKNLYQAAKEYVDTIEEIEKTHDPTKLQLLEEMRVDLHWTFVELLNEQGIAYQDREHATRIAMRIAKGEL